MQFVSVQTFLGKKLAGFLSEELQAQVDFDRFFFQPFSSISFSGLQIYSPTGEPLLQAGKLEADIRLKSLLLENSLIIDRLVLEDSKLAYIAQGDQTNWQFLLDKFAPKKENNTPGNSKLNFALNEVSLRRISIDIKTSTAAAKPGMINFGDISLSNLSVNLRDIDLTGGGLQMLIKDLSFQEKSGFSITNADAALRLDGQQLSLAEFQMQTKHSRLSGDLDFSFRQWKDFKDFNQRVEIDWQLRDSHIQSSDIAFFTSAVPSSPLSLAIDQVHASGSIAKLNLNDLQLRSADSSVFIADAQVTGLPNFAESHYDVQIRELQSTPEELGYIFSEFGQTKPLPQAIQALGKTSFKGSLNGVPENGLNLLGDWHSALGNMHTELVFSLSEGSHLDGQFQSDKFQIGALLNSKTIQSTGFNLQLAGSLNQPIDRLQAEGYLSELTWAKNSYDSIAFVANLQENIIQAEGEIFDPLMQVDFELDFIPDSIENSYELYADINHIDLKSLGILPRDSIIINNSLIHSLIKGNDLNNLTGHLDAKQISMESSKGIFAINDVYFKAEGNQQQRSLSLFSDVLDLKMDGQIDLNTIVPYFKALAMRYAPAIGLETQAYNPQIFDLSLNIKSFEAVAAFLQPSLLLEDGARLEAHFSSEDFHAAFKAFSPFVSFQGFDLHDVSIDQTADLSAFSLNAKAKQLILTDKLSLKDIEINNLLSQDSLRFAIQAASQSDSSSVQLAGNIHFAQDKPAYIRINSSKLKIADELWVFNEDSQMRVSKGKFYFSNLQVSQGSQHLIFNGILSNEDDRLNIELQQVNLDAIKSFTQPLGINLAGKLNGELSINSAFNHPYFTANLHSTPLTYNQIPIGQMVLNADFDPRIKWGNIELQLLDKQQRSLAISGGYGSRENQASLELRARLNRLDLRLAQPFLKNLSSQLEGYASAELQINGALGQPRISGRAKLEDASFLVDYLGTTYHFTQPELLIDENKIMLADIEIRDAQQHQALAGGFIDLNQVSDPYIDLNIQANNLEVLHTSFRDNPTYYGRAFASGSFHFQGRSSALQIDIDAKAEEHSTITIPFNSAMTVADSDFIYFISPDSSAQQQNRRIQGMTLAMNLVLDANTEVNLQTDIGSLSGNGDGEIALRLSSLGDFEIFGDYTINSGKFHFTAQDFFNKYFDLKQGGTVRWMGRPSDASINMTAMYQQRTSVGTLYAAAGRTGQDERVLAQADMNISGTLSNPDVSFDLTFPQTPYVKDELQAYLSDANNVNQQALSLILRRSFSANSSEQFGQQVNSTLLSAGTEIAFNQLNNILSQSLNIDFVDLNIRSLNDASASLRFFDDRLILTGGIVDRRNIQTSDLTFFSNQVATDAELTYKFRRDGSLMFRAYNRLNTRNILFTPTDDYINALGLVYRQEFNSLGEFFRRMWFKNRQKDPSNTPKKSR